MTNRYSRNKRGNNMITIQWHKGKPEADGFYLVTTATGLVRMDRYYTINSQFEAAKNPKAWAQMPDPYQEETCE